MTAASSAQMLAPVADFERRSASSRDARFEAATVLLSSELPALLRLPLLSLSSLHRQAIQQTGHTETGRPVDQKLCCTAIR